MKTVDPVIRRVPIFPLKKSARMVSDVINARGVALLPTDTCYGLSAGAIFPGAIRRIARLKLLTAPKSFIVLIKSIPVLVKLKARLPSYFYRVENTLVPGPLTMVLYSDRMFFGRVKKIAVRIPDDKFLRAVLGGVSAYGIVSTSANITGDAEPYDFKKVHQHIREKVDIAVDAGALKTNLPSTIVNFAKNPPELIREGAVPIEQIEDILRIKLKIPPFRVPERLRQNE